MKRAGVVFSVLVATVALCGWAWGQDAAPASEPTLAEAVRHRQGQIDQKLATARNRIKHKNFIAARNAVQDAAVRLRRIQAELPPQRVVSRLVEVEKHVKDRAWADARMSLETAFRELDTQARYIDVTKIWQHLDEARGFVADRRGNLALQSIRAAKRYAYLDDVATPLRRALVYMSDARRELFKLPTIFKSKRAAAIASLDGADEELTRAYAGIDRLLAGDYATGSR